MAPKVPASERTVLVVDDDEDILLLLQILIHRDGFRILTASDGLQALKVLREGPHAVVLDLLMPGETDGFRVLETLASLAAAPAVVVITGSTSAADEVRKGGALCVKAVLNKPIRQEDLLKELHKALGTVAVKPRTDDRPPGS